MSPFVLEMFNCGPEYVTIHVNLVMEIQAPIVWLAILEAQFQGNVLALIPMQCFSKKLLVVLMNAIEVHILLMRINIVTSMRVWNFNKIMVHLIFNVFRSGKVCYSDNSLNWLEIVYKWSRSDLKDFHVWWLGKCR